VIDTSPPRLRRIRLLQSVPDPELRALEARCRWLRYRTGAPILDRQSESRDVLFVVEGSARVVDYSLAGREIVYAVIGPGGHFGELSAIDGQTRSAVVIAVEDCLLAALVPEAFEALLRRHPEVALRLLRGLVTIIRTTDERITELSTLGAVQRVGRELLRLAAPDPSTPRAWSIAKLPTQQSIASRAGTSRETVARTLAQLAADGVIERHGKVLRIFDRRRLEALIERLPTAIDRPAGG
jgi:CRP-like cAMP-binding protein